MSLPVSDGNAPERNGAVASRRAFSAMQFGGFLAESGDFYGGSLRIFSGRHAVAETSAVCCH